MKYIRSFNEGVYSPISNESFDSDYFDSAFIDFLDSGANSLFFLTNKPDYYYCITIDLPVVIDRRRIVTIEEQILINRRITENYKAIEAKLLDIEGCIEKIKIDYPRARARTTIEKGQKVHVVFNIPIIKPRKRK